MPERVFEMPKFEDIFEEIGRKLDGEIERLRAVAQTEISPTARRKAAGVLRRVSGGLERFAKELESEIAPKEK
jgi:hypothetical protein